MTGLETRLTAGTENRTEGSSGATAARRPHSWRRRRLVQLWAAGGLASVLVTGASALGYLQGWQTWTLDLVARLGGRRFPAEVVIVAVDDDAFRSLGARQPIPRAYLARLVRGVTRSGAAVIGLDVTLSIATTPDEDAALAGAILDATAHGVSRVVLVDGPFPASGPLAAAVFRDGVPHGSDRVPVDADGLIRRAAVLVPAPSGAPVPALSLALLARLGALDGGSGFPRWQAGTGWVPDADPPAPLRTDTLWRVNFVGPRGSFLTIPSDAVAALGDVVAPAVAEDNPLRGRIVLIGATFTDSRDEFSTPVGRLPGVEIHANLVHMLATRSLVRPSGWLLSLGIQLAVAMLVGLILTALRPLPGTLLALALTLAVGVPASYLAFHGGGYAVDFVLPVLVTCGVGLGAEALARQRFRDAFGRYVGREVMARVVAEDPALAGDRREVSILISDLRGFTTLSETLPVEKVAAHLNEYFPAMIDAIFAERGMVNDFIGDGILAVFGAPLPDADHAWRAGRAAVAMEAALGRLNRAWDARGLPTLRMGIAIHTGLVFAGNVGGSARIKYTVVGDAVNVTARLEGLNRDLGTTMLLTEATRRALGDRAETRYCGEVPVKGRAEPLRVFELLRMVEGGSA